MSATEITTIFPYSNIVLFFLLLIFIFVIGVFILNMSDRKKLVYGKKKTKRALLSFSMSREFKMLSNINLQLGEANVHFDYLVIGFFGLLSVNVLERQGEYCGEQNDATWMLIQDAPKQTIENPIKQNANALAILKKQLGKELNVYKFATEQLTVFGGLESKTIIYTKASDKICYVKDLKKALRHNKFNQDNDINVAQILEYVTSKIV